jgi:VWFA-related protein
MRISSRIAAAAVCALLVGRVPAPDLSAQNSRVAFDIVVTDARSKPLAALRPEDIELSDAGIVRSVERVERQADGNRVIGIFLDEFHVRSGESTSRAKSALTRFVESQLRDGDIVAIAKPLDPLHAIAFTNDRTAIRAALEAFEGHAGDYTPRSEFERNFMSRDPKTADATRAQVVSAALQALSRRLGEQHGGRKALIVVSEGFRPPQPRQITYAANRNGVAIHAIDPGIEPGEHDPMLQSLARQTGGHASTNEADLTPALTQATLELDHYFLVTFEPVDAGDGRFHPVEVRMRRAGTVARARSGYWAHDASLAAAAELAAKPRYILPFRPAHSSQYIRPWVGMSRGRDGLTTVTITWEPGAAPPRNQRVASINVKATAADGTVLFDDRIGAGDLDRAAFDAPPGPIAIEMAIHSASGAPLDTDYRGVTVPNLVVSKPTIATPQVLRTRTARQFSDASRNPNAMPAASRTFSRTERLIIRVPAYGAGGSQPHLAAHLMNRRGSVMGALPRIEDALPDGPVQFDLRLAALAPGEYRVEFTASNTSGTPDEVREMLVFRVTD